MSQGLVRRYFIPIFTDGGSHKTPNLYYGISFEDRVTEWIQSMSPLEEVNNRCDGPDENEKEVGKSFEPLDNYVCTSRRLSPHLHVHPVPLG